jgi:hypothetical protein
MSLHESIDAACAQMEAWLRTLPAWPKHPTNTSGSVSSHFGPTILSEEDCVMHFARFLADASVAWDDMHLELSPGQWMYTAEAGAPMPKRIDLAVMRRERLQSAGLPVAPGSVPLEAVCEFALASNYWEYGGGSPKVIREKVETDVAKVANYLHTGLADQGYVIVIEECDHSFTPAFVQSASIEHGVDVRLLRSWQ